MKRRIKAFLNASANIPLIMYQSDFSPVMFNQHMPFAAYGIRYDDYGSVPFSAPTRASPIPWLPLVGSTIIVSGPIRPVSSAALIILSAAALSGGCARSLPERCYKS